MTRNQIRRWKTRLGLAPDGSVWDFPARVSAELREVKLQVGAMQVALMRANPPSDVRSAEFKVFSQFGEDGILQYLISKVGALPETFVEFGVEDYTEANSLFLLLHCNWRGLILDGSQTAMESVRGRDLYWRHDLEAVAAFIDRDNINGLIREHGFSREIGLLSVDIDGNDYWVWQAIDVVDPVIVVVEYNSLFGARRAVSVPYDANFQRTRAHSSNLYWGCSLAALCSLADKKGYVFVGCNRAGNNAFFVRAGRQGDLAVLSPAEGYVEARFRESRGPQGELTFLSGRARLDAIAALPLIDVETGQQLRVGELLSDSATR